MPPLSMTQATGQNAAQTITQVLNLADNTATTVFTITCPNQSLGAVIQVTAIGSLGAGGTVGAFEASAAATFEIVVTRVAGVAAASAACALQSSTGSATSSGADSCTIARSLVAWSGAATAVNTQAVQMTVTRGAGASANHSLLLIISVYNVNANGITIG